MSDNNDFVSSVKLIPYSQTAVYTKVQDLRNLEKLKARFNDPAFVQQLEGQFGADKVAEAQQKLQSLQVTQDTISIESPVGQVTLAIIEREEPKCVKFEAQGSPVAVNMWIQLLPDGDNACKMRLTVRAELSFFIRKMVEGKLSAGVEQIAEILAHIPYGD